MRNPNSSGAGAALHFPFLGLISFIIFMGWLAVSLLPQRTDERLHLEIASFENLPGWAEDDLGGALLAFQASCEKFATLNPNAPVSPQDIGGVVADWLGVCDVAMGLDAEDQVSARAFFENNFEPFLIWASGQDTGLLTGYYEPLMEGSFERSAEYSTPLYVRPPELVMVNLGQFRKDLAGRRIAGQIENGQLRPFSSRADIDDGALDNRGLELIWLKSPVDAFFLAVQGSGRVQLPDGQMVKIGYAAQNGHPYSSIGRVLVDRGEIPLEEISMQSIRVWMEANPGAATALMQENASYVFFRQLDGAGDAGGPVGSQGVELVPGRSLAVDRTVLPLGAPIWLDGSRPDENDPVGQSVPLRRLMVAQDTGGAIRGALRGDVFWGLGEAAEAIAGHMVDRGARFHILLPKNIAVRFQGAG